MVKEIKSALSGIKNNLLSSATVLPLTFERAHRKNKTKQKKKNRCKRGHGGDLRATYTFMLLKLHGRGFLFLHYDVKYMRQTGAL